MPERNPTLLAALLLTTGTLLLSACTTSDDDPDPAAAESPGAAVEEETVEEDIVTEGEPEGDESELETYQAAVDCLVEKGAADEGYTTAAFEADLFGGFLSGEADPEHPEFTDCLALSDVEISFEN